MKCTSCGNTFSDGVQCGSCKKHLDFGCAQISEAGWKKLGAERRAAWKCSSCKGLSPTPQTSASGPDSATLETVLKEIREMKTQLAGLPSLMADVKTIKKELSDLKSSYDFAINRIDEVSGRLSGVENKVSNLERLEITVSTLQSEVSSLKAQLSASDLRTRMNNVEIKGVPQKNDENLFTVVEAISKKVNYSFPKAQINYIYRVPSYNPKEKSIIVSFTNRYVKEEFVAAARATKTLTSADIGVQGTSQRIFVNDHLNADTKNLLNSTKTLAKEKSFSYVWVKYGKIHVRKNDTSRVFVVSKESDLNKIS